MIKEIDLSFDLVLFSLLVLFITFKILVNTDICLKWLLQYIQIISQKTRYRSKLNVSYLEIKIQVVEK